MDFSKHIVSCTFPVLSRKGIRTDSKLYGVRCCIQNRDVHSSVGEMLFGGEKNRTILLYSKKTFAGG